MGGAQSRPAPSATPEPAVSTQHIRRKTCRKFADCGDQTSKHRSQFIHSSDIPSCIDYRDRPPCWYWETCYRQDGKKSEHMAKYLHPWELADSGKVPAVHTGNIGAGKGLSSTNTLQDSDEVRVVLIGKTGVGKSLSCNTLLGEEKFKSCLSFQSETGSCQYDYVKYHGKKYMIIDTPGIFDTNVNEQQNAIELLKCVAICAPGPHVFFITIAIGHGRYTEEDKKTIDLCRKIFGDGIMKHAVVLFTGGDKMIEENMTEEEMMITPVIKKLIKDCGGRTFIMNNKTSDDQRTNQAEDLMMKVNEWGLDKTAYKDKHGLFKKVEEIFMNEQRDKNTSRDDIRESIMKNLRKAKPYMELIIKAIGPMLAMIPDQRVQVFSRVMTAVSSKLILPLLELWLAEEMPKET
ncbi:unnamed protein product [Owenia fusiformis]|uniref:Uncharacterized protein n=1 Tax=Owenia fusiformis TaxID=6347 RepID=A0A8J1UPC4_OWEFU|nr:unnamed protein product [Owenia fusiformis]